MEDYEASPVINIPQTGEVEALAREMVAGTLGGCCGIFVGQPFDTIKVRLQTQSEMARLYGGGLAYKGPLHCFRQILSQEGPMALYKGMSFPLLSNGPLNAVVFSSYGRACRYYSKDGDIDQLSYSQIFRAGCFAGVAQSFIMCPTEVVKIKRQVMKNTSHLGAVDMAMNLVQRHGLRKGLFSGFWATVARDSVRRKELELSVLMTLFNKCRIALQPSFGAYFVSYEYIKRRLMAYREEQRDMDFLIAGGIAGMVSWTCTYPVDVIKSCVQMAGITTFKDTLDIVKRNYSSQGLRFFFDGCSTAVLRGVPVNAVTFLVYEKVIQLMEDDEEDEGWMDAY